MGAIYLYKYALVDRKANFTQNHVKSLMNGLSRGPDSRKLQSVNSNRASQSPFETTTLTSRIRSGKFPMSNKTKQENANIVLMYHRLSITGTGPEADQPFEFWTTVGKIKVTLMCDGQIYNYQTIEDANPDLKLIPSRSTSDVEIIGRLYVCFRDLGCTAMEAIQRLVVILDGEFAFVIIENLGRPDSSIYAARDYSGQRMLHHTQRYIVTDPSMIPSDITDSLSVLPPGSVLDFQTTSVGSMAMPFPGSYVLDQLMTQRTLPRQSKLESIMTTLKTLVVSSVLSRVPQANTRFGVLVKGFDSFLVASIILDNLPTSELVLFTAGQYPNVMSQVTFLESHYRVPVTLCLADTMENIHTACESTSVKVLLTGMGCDDTFAQVDAQVHAPQVDPAHLDQLFATKGIQLRHPYTCHDFMYYMSQLDAEFKKPAKFRSGAPEVSKYVLRRAFSPEFLNGKMFLNDSVLWN